MTRSRRRRHGSLHKWVRVTEGLKEILESERTHSERFNDTIYRIMMEKGRLAKENYDLKGHIDNLTRAIEDLRSKLELESREVEIRA
jgi:hypothetical protein